MSVHAGLWAGICVALAGTLMAGPAHCDEALRAAGAGFQDYDANGDGVAEIRYVRQLDLSREAGETPVGTVLLLVEPRLLEGCGAVYGPRPSALLRALETWADDLRAEGWRVRGVAMQVYDGPAHQDGRTLLAIREYLRAVKAALPDLAGVVMVGSFPEACLVRSYNWRQQGPTTITNSLGQPQDFGGKPVVRLRTRSEVVAARCDIVLADLDGNWEKLYYEGPEDLRHVMAAYPDLTPPEGVSAESEWFAGGPTSEVEIGADRVEDFFLVDDGKLTITELPDGRLDIRALDDQQDDECGTADRARPNALACPDILVSRINARNVGLRPRPDIKGTDGLGLLDEAGKPRTVTFASEAATPRAHTVWEQDPATEMQLLLEFMDRNHRYRRGDFREQFTPASASYGLDSFMPELQELRATWKDHVPPASDLQGEEATLTAVASWLRRPAVLRAIAAHSDPWGSHFAEAKDAEALVKACGGQAWAWVKEGNKLVPSLGAGAKLDMGVERTLWQNGAIPDSASLYLHSGCDITAPGGAGQAPYNHPDYAYWQGAEGLMFYCKGLALVGRSKTFYDFPTGFAAQLGEGKTFGEAWRHYYEVESAASDVDAVGGGIGRKRAYFWNVLGDWTLRLVG